MIPSPWHEVCPQELGPDAARGTVIECRFRAREWRSLAAQLAHDLIFAVEAAWAPHVYCKLVTVLDRSSGYRVQYSHENSS